MNEPLETAQAHESRKSAQPSLAVTPAGAGTTDPEIGTSFPRQQAPRVDDSLGAGTRDPEIGTCFPRPGVVYFDWSFRTGVTWLKNDEEEVRVSRTLLDLLDELDSPHVVVGETTFESFDLERRKIIIDRCSREGHTLRVVPNRLTARNRLSMGLEKKTDSNDVRAIRAMVQRGVHLRAPHEPDCRLVAKRKAANGRLMNLRRSGILKPRPRAAGFSFTSEKELYADQLIGRLPAYKDLPGVRQRALGNGREYSKVIVAAVGVVAEFATSTREFDSLSGLSAGAYPSQIRADLMHWGWAGGNERPKLNGSPGGIRKRDDLTLSQYRRELRWLYHQLIELGEVYAK